MKKAHNTISTLNYLVPCQSDFVQTNLIIYRFEIIFWEGFFNKQIHRMGKPLNHPLLSK